jgi:hypothetical protein
MVILPLSLYVKKGKMGVNLQLKSRLRRSCDDVVNLVLISPTLAPVAQLCVAAPH